MSAHFTTNRVHRAHADAEIRRRTAERQSREELARKLAAIDGARIGTIGKR